MKINHIHHKADKTADTSPDKLMHKFYTQFRKLIMINVRFDHYITIISKSKILVCVYTHC